MDSSIHQLGVSHFPTFHWTNSAKSSTWWALVVSPHPHCLMSLVTPIGRRPLLVPTLAVPPNQHLCLWTPHCLMASQGRQDQLTWQHPLFLPLSLDLQQSRLLDLTLNHKWALIQVSLSISSSKVAVVDSTLWCTMCILVRLLSTKLSCSQWGFLLLDGWEFPGLGWTRA